MVSSARPTPHPKRHLDRFSRFSTARGYVYSHSHAPCNIANNIKAAPLCMRCILWEQWAAHSDGESPRGHRIMSFVSPSKHYWLKYQRTHAQTNGQAENMMPPRPTRSATKASIYRRIIGGCLYESFIHNLYTQPWWPIQMPNKCPLAPWTYRRGDISSIRLQKFHDQCTRCGLCA